jgi:hypothetical protein
MILRRVAEDEASAPRETDPHMGHTLRAEDEALALVSEPRTWMEMEGPHHLFFYHQFDLLRGKPSSVAHHARREDSCRASSLRPAL